MENQQEMLNQEIQVGNFTKERAEMIEKKTNMMLGGPPCIQVLSLLSFLIFFSYKFAKHFFTKIASFVEPTMTVPKNFNEHSMKQLMLAVQVRN